MVLSAIFFVSLVLSAAANPMERRVMAVHETRAEPATGFVNSGVAPATTEITLRIAMTQNNIAGLEEALYAVSDPASTHRLRQVATFVKPTDATLSAVSAWLTENGISSTPVTPAGDIIEIAIPVSKANDLLSTEFSTFTHVDSGKTSIRTLAYSIPADLQGHIDNVHPTTSFTRPLAVPKFTAIKAEKRAVAASCDDTITPTCLQDIYGIPATPATQSTNKLGVSGFIDQWANEADLTEFLQNVRTDISSATTFTLQTLDGGENIQTRADAGIEANLDTQYTIGVATDVPVTFISVGENNRDGVDGFMDIITTLIGEATGTRPNVLTTSYGFDESDLSRSVANTLCNAYMQLGALGTSILFSSGDGGVSGSQAQSCTNFIPTLPSDCPFVTSVGATQGTTETAASFSSGGEYFARSSVQLNTILQVSPTTSPSPATRAQTDDVAAYLSTLGETNAGHFNRTGRGFPDVAAQGVNFEIAWDTELGTVDGTSCSSPTFASVVALLNDRLVAAGKSPLGFLNPFLYTTGRAALNDITSGKPLLSLIGFPAVAGWDPVTGLGTPNFAALLTAVGL
ncbi:Peptidase S53 domain-containing protein [Mycena sanguinolenta]|uniref:tripeptidyl-peptidase II n=1 Tax=Mycena sanguinolenta TaxID=230812 RepID=A0A8H7DHQ2_9AGAR|nr:Peptidase S53 domain-containing protein [Mycena sanguinolenta]